MVTIPVSLSDPGLRPVWEAVRRRLERSGVDNRGRLRLPSLSPRHRHVLASLTERTVTSTIALDALESGLVRLGIGSDLVDALTHLGEPVSQEPALRRAARAEAEAARQHARHLVATWQEGWASQWIDETIRAGLMAGMGRDEAIRFVSAVRRVLDALPAPGDPPVSRVDLAALAAGSSHALDDGSRLASAVTRALHHLSVDPGVTNLWEESGIQPDLLSGPALTWGLAARPRTDLASLLATASELGVPLHLSQFVLRRHRLRPTTGTDILVVENPRVVEAAAQRRLKRAVVATNGQPSGAVRLLLDQLQEGDATLRYHGDFDPTGLAICARMHERGIRPWRMDSIDYVQALQTADVWLPTTDRPAGATPWDPELQAEFNRQHVVVHEERVLDQILD